MTLPYKLRSCSILFGKVTSLSLAAYVLQYTNYIAWRGFRLPPRKVIRQNMSVLGIHVMYSAWNTKDNYDMSASVFVVQFNGFISLTI